MFEKRFLTDSFLILIIYIAAQGWWLARAYAGAAANNRRHGYLLARGKCCDDFLFSQDQYHVIQLRELDAMADLQKSDIANHF
jgi:hypothetical protein